MTHPPMTDLDATCVDILAGLEGVTPGPWGWRWKDSSLRQRCVDGPFEWKGGVILQAREDYNGNTEISEANAAHIARLDPDTLRALIEDRPRLKAEVDRLTTINASLMGDDETQPRYTTQRLRQEIDKATEEARLENERLAREVGRLREALTPSEKWVEAIATKIHSDEDNELGWMHPKKANVRAQMRRQVRDVLEAIRAMKKLPIAEKEPST